MRVRVARDEGIVIEDESEMSGLGSSIEIAQDRDRHAGFLCQIANEEFAFVELRGCEHFVRELVHGGDAAIDHDHVGTARVADLQRYHGIELTAEHGERIRRRRCRREAAIVERRPGFILALGDLHLEAVFLGEKGIGIGFETAVRNDQSAVACVLADVDLQRIVFGLIRRRRFQGRCAVDGLDRRWRIAIRFAALDGACGLGSRGAVFVLLAEQQIGAECDQPDKQQQRDHIARGRAPCSVPLRYPSIRSHVRAPLQFKRIHPSGSAVPRLHCDTPLARRDLLLFLGLNSSAGGGSSVRSSRPANSSR